MMHELVLAGCRPKPLANYLKALGVLRLVGEQADPGVCGFWRDDNFVLRTTLAQEELLRFFLYDYSPTPIIAPWNGGSGFYPKDNKEALEGIASSSAERLASYRTTIEVAQRVLSQMDVVEKVAAEEKRTLLLACRNTLPESALPWLDAAYLISTDSAKYPPLLGTGGNDGRLDFTNNFMQRLVELVDLRTGGPRVGVHDLLKGALLDLPTDQQTGGAIGQFLPAGAGGANAGAGFDGGPRFNPWDFILMLEGAVMFAVAAVRRLERQTQGALSYPFTVRTSGVGYASAHAADESASRGEMWLPLWTRPARYVEIGAIFAEGRARVGGRPARHGVDFARAVATLGLDRGITSLQRYGFQVRNGLAYFATPLDRVEVREVRTARLLDEIDGWLDSFRRRASSDRAPAAARRALRGLESAIIDLCRRESSDRVQAVLVALGRCERAMARSLRWVTDPKVRLSPVPPLSPQWLDAADDASAEFRLAAALSSVVATHKERYMPLRCQLEPVACSGRRGRLRVEWDPNADRDVVWRDGSLVQTLNAIAARRIMTFEQWGAAHYIDQAAQPASLEDVAAFVEGRTNDDRIALLVWASSLVDWPRFETDALRFPSGARTSPPAVYALLKLCFDPTRADDLRVPLVPRIHRLAMSGRGWEASRAAARRLRASGFQTAIEGVSESVKTTRRAAAAILFPIRSSAIAQVRASVLRPTQQPGEATQ